MILVSRLSEGRLDLLPFQVSKPRLDHDKPRRFLSWAIIKLFEETPIKY